MNKTLLNNSFVNVKIYNFNYIDFLRVYQGDGFDIFGLKIFTKNQVKKDLIK